MAVNGLQSRPQQVLRQLPPQMRMPAAQGQFPFPADRVQVNSKFGPRSGVNASKALSELKPEELQALGGGAALETIARVQPRLTVGEAQPLLKNKPALDSIANLMESRDDLKVSDFVSRDKKGRIRIDPSTKDPEAMEFLKERPDIRPSQLSAMRANFTKKFKNPSMGKAASKKAIQLMKKRTDMMPDDATQLMDQIAKAAGVGQKGAKGADQGAAPQAALDMFDSASKVLAKRSDLKPDQVGQLATSVGKLGSPKDKQRAERVAEGFDAATKSLEANPMRRPDEMSKMAETIGENFAGGDEKTAGFRMNAFKQSSQMMGENPQMDAKSVGNYLKQAKERDPKIKNAPPAKRAQLLAKSMDNLSAGVKSGKVSANNLSQHFDNKKADENRGKINKGQGKNQQGVGDKKPEKKETAKTDAKTQGKDKTTVAKDQTKVKGESRGTEPKGQTEGPNQSKKGSTGESKAEKPEVVTFDQGSEPKVDEKFQTAKERSESLKTPLTDSTSTAGKNSGAPGRVRSKSKSQGTTGEGASSGNQGAALQLGQVRRG